MKTAASNWPRVVALAVMAAASGAVTAGCGKSSGAIGTLNVESGLGGIQDQIFTKTCAFASCHSGAQAAAHLDLEQGKSCASLVGVSSCLFPSRLLVSPGAPAQSFLLDKLTGAGAGTTPDSLCVGTSNARMPFGAQPLSAAQISQISDWITGGAACDDGSSPPPEASDGSAPPDPDGAAGAPADAGPPPVALVVTPVSVSSDGATLVAGQKAEVTVHLSGPAAAGGQILTIAPDDPTVIANPDDAFAAAGETDLTFAVMGLRPGTARLSITANAVTVQTEFAVTGLYLTEIFPGSPGGRANAQWIKLVNGSNASIDLGGYRLGAGVGVYATASAALSGILPPGACFLVGGPYSGDDNGDPQYAQAIDFSPDLPAGPDATGEAAAYGLFDAAATLTPSTRPVDAVALGTENSARLLDQSGVPLVPVSAGLAAGQSLARTALTAWSAQSPAPSACVVFHDPTWTPPAMAPPAAPDGGADGGGGGGD